MRDLNALNEYRLTDQSVVNFFGWTGDETCGVFRLPSPRTGASLFIIASTGEGWDHVSVSVWAKNRCPNWQEMEHAKRAFFNDDETAMQLHVPPADHINFSETTLHLWRPQKQSIPRPPGEMVGPKKQPA